MKGASSFEQFSAFIKHQKGGGGQAFQRSFVWKVNWQTNHLTAKTKERENDKNTAFDL